MELSPGAIAISMVRHRRGIFFAVVATALLTSGLTLLVPNEYTSITSFVPESGQRTSLSGVAGLAAIAGIQVPGTDLARSPDFYADLLRSDPLLYAALEARYPRPKSSSISSDSVRLLDVLRPPGADEAERLFLAAKSIRQRHLDVRVERRTNVVEVRFTYRDPILAAAVANELVHQLELFNAQTRRTQARARRTFLETQVAQAESTLQQAEDGVRSFLERNRSYQNSPSLNFEADRLRRRVQVQQDLYLSLRRDLSVARIDEVNDQPTVTIIESAIPPVRKSAPARARIVILAVVVGFVVAAAAVWAYDYRGGFSAQRRLLLEALRGSGPGVAPAGRND